MRRFRKLGSGAGRLGSLPLLTQYLASALALSCQGSGPSGEALVVGQCADARDNDRNGAIDCADVACAGYDGCPVRTSIATGTSEDPTGGTGSSDPPRAGASTGAGGTSGGTSTPEGGTASPSGGNVATTAGSGGRITTTGGAGGTGGPPLAVDDCGGISLQADGVLDVDIRTVRVAGNVTLNGAPFPDEESSRGAVTFVDTERGTRVSYDLGPEGSATYSLTLPPGVYDVVFDANPMLCATPDLPQAPCGGGTLATAIALTADGVVDVDVPVVTLSGSVTLNSAAFPDEVDGRGALEFRSAEVSVLTRPLPVTGAATYGVTLFPGTYDVVFVGSAANCARDEASIAPCNSGKVLDAISVTTGVLDVDVGAVTVSGNVTLAGRPLPEEAADRGAVSLSGEGLSPATSASFGTTGSASFAMTVLFGTYDVAFVGNPALCIADAASSVPCNVGTLASALPLLADGALDLDLTPVTVSGTATLDGAPFPTESGARGSFAFERADGGAALTRDFASSGPATYSLTLLAGTYDISYVANPTLCTLDSTPEVPCNGGPLSKALALMTSGVVDLDVESVRVAGNVTVNGAPMGDETGDRGAIAFSSAEGGVVLSPPFGTSGATTYSLSLFPGDYSVSLVANPALCTGDTTPGVPCIGGTLLSTVPLRADGALDLDVPTVRLSGSVTLDGQPLPDANGSRGTIGFFHLSHETSASGGDLAASGDGTYRITLLPGDYTVSHVANPALCGPGLSSDVPCGSQVLLGCD